MLLSLAAFQFLRNRDTRPMLIILIGSWKGALMMKHECTRAERPLLNSDSIGFQHA